MIKPCYATQTQPPNNMEEYFPTESVYKYPPLMICPSTKLDKHNEAIFQRNETFMFNMNGIEGCSEQFNLKNYGNLQAGYSQNIDIDSELKNINYIADKCYQNNYKTRPDDQNSRLRCHSNILIKDYEANEQGRLIEGQNPTSEPTLNLHNVQSRRAGPLYPDKEVINGTLGQPSAHPSPNCVNPESFEVCPYFPPHQNQNVPVHYHFNNEDYIGNYPCQRLFNNVTKRKMIPTWHQRHDINPDSLATVCLGNQKKELNVNLYNNF